MRFLPVLHLSVRRNEDDGAMAARGRRTQKLISPSTGVVVCAEAAQRQIYIKQWQAPLCVAEKIVSRLGAVPLPPLSTKCVGNFAPLTP